MEMRVSIESAISGTAASDIADTTALEIIAAQGTNMRVNLTDVLITNASASVGTVVQILDGTTVKARIYAASGGGGVAHRFMTPLRGTANTAWKAKCETTGAAVQATFCGIKYPR